MILIGYFLRKHARWFQGMHLNLLLPTNCCINHTNSEGGFLMRAALTLFGPRQANLILPPMRAANVQASLRIRAVSPEPPLLAHTSIESRGTCRQPARSLIPPNGWTCADKICHDEMLEDTNSLDGAHLSKEVLSDSNYVFSATGVTLK